MQTENWHEERDRLVELLHCAHALGIRRDRKSDPRQATTSGDLAVLEKRLAQLNERLGDERARTFRLGRPRK